MRWNETAVAKTKWSNYVQELYGSWDVVYDQSTSALVEFVAKRGNDAVYVNYEPSKLDKLPEEQRRRELAWHIDQYDNAMDFRSFLHCKKDPRLSKITV